MNWDTYFYKLAFLISEKSKDQSTKIGAVIVGPDNEIRSTGYNSFPRGLNDDLPERQERPEKYLWFEHAERNAIYNAARVGTPLRGTRIFLSCFTPCTGCARAIIQAGISEVILGKKTSSRAKWDEEAKRSEAMFQEAGVKVRFNEACEKL